MKTTLFVCLATWLLVPRSISAQAKPFTSVPLNSWTYTTYNRLVKIGFAKPVNMHTELSGQHTFTRYEFAVLTEGLSHRLAVKTNHIKHRTTVVSLVSKLAKEFRPEIETLKSTHSG